MEEHFFEYGPDEIEHLAGKDPVLGAFIHETGVLRRPVEPDLFKALASSLVSQQISGSAAVSIFRRLEALCDLSINPSVIVDKTTEELKSCGLSRNKAEYLRNAAEKICSGEFVLDDLASLPDNEVIQKLVTLKGVGVWTAEMLLIFSLRRPNVLSYGDLGIRHGIMKLYGWKTLSPMRFKSLVKRYSPYGSIASFYLWHRVEMK